MIRQIFAVALKDLTVEWRSPARLIGVAVFALAIVLMIAFAAGSHTRALREVAGGTLWVGLLLASTRSLDQSFAIELEQGALEGLVLWPVHPVAVYYGKAIANWFLALLVSFALTPLTIALYGVSLRGHVYELVAFLVLGTAALAAPGTLLAAITSQARGSSVLLPLLLFPLVVPPLMAAGRGTSLVIEGDPLGLTLTWLVILGIFNVVHWSLSGILFARVVEDS